MSQFIRKFAAKLTEHNVFIQDHAEKNLIGFGVHEKTQDFIELQGSSNLIVD